MWDEQNRRRGRAYSPILHALFQLAKILTQRTQLFAASNIPTADLIWKPAMTLFNCGVVIRQSLTFGTYLLDHQDF